MAQGPHPQYFIPTGRQKLSDRGFPVGKQSGQGAEQMRNRSPLLGNKDLKCVLLPQVGAALSLALTGDHSCMADHGKLSN